MAKFKFTMFFVGILFALGQAASSFAQPTLQARPITPNTTVIITPPSSGGPVNVRIAPAPRGSSQAVGGGAPSSLESRKEQKRLQLQQAR